MKRNEKKKRQETKRKKKRNEKKKRREKKRKKEEKRKVNNKGVVKNTFIFRGQGGRKSKMLLEGLQVSPVRPSDRSKNTVRMY